MEKIYNQFLENLRMNHHNYNVLIPYETPLPLPIVEYIRSIESDSEGHEKYDFIMNYYEKAFKNKSLIYLFGDYLFEFKSKHKLSNNQFLFAYMKTINLYIKEYTLKELFAILDISSTSISHIFFTQLSKDTFPLNDAEFVFRLGCIVIANNYDKIIDSYKNPKILQIGKEVFHAKDVTSKKDYQNYVQLNNEFYQEFMNALYEYIFFLNMQLYHDKDFLVDARTIIDIFLTHAKWGNYFSKEKIEECLRLFAEHNILSERGLKLLIENKSSYTDEYKSLILMEDLKNEK